MESLKGLLYFIGLGNLENYTGEQWLWIALATGFIAYVFYNRKRFVALFDGAVIMAETSFNHGNNSKKLDAAINFIIIRTETLPIFARIVIRYFLSRKKIIDTIEKSLQKFSDVFGSGKRIDIKGNE